VSLCAKVAAWPPSGKERKFVLTTWRVEFVVHDAAVSGELVRHGSDFVLVGNSASGQYKSLLMPVDSTASEQVRLAPEFAKGSIYSKYAGQVGRLTQVII